MIVLDMLSLILVLDSCKVNNGGCGPNTVCSHDPTTNVVVCTCNIGYTNTGSASNVICSGRQSALVDLSLETVLIFVYFLFSDTCQVNRGGCHINAVCSHETTSNAVQCICKTGYTNTGTASNATCTGRQPT